MNLKVNRLNASGTTYIEEKTVSDGDSEHVVPVIGFETYRNYTWLFNKIWRCERWNI